MSKSLIPIVAAVTAWSCRAPEPTVVDLAPAVLLEKGAESASSYFGGSYPGKSYWLSDNNRYAVIYQWREDTNHDGRVSISIGYHGDMEEDEPRPYLIETISGTITPYDEFLAASHGRWVALRRGPVSWVIDSESDARIQLSDGIASTDHNDCAGPREVIFDPYRPRIGVIYDQPDQRFVVRDLMTQRERAIPAEEGRLWRAYFTAIADVFVLYYVAEDTASDTLPALPTQRTTCSTRFGTMFAASYSFLGWEGRPFYPVVVSRRTTTRVSGSPLVVSDNLMANGDSLFDLSGDPVPIPPGCDRHEVAPGASIVLLRCKGETHAWNPETRNTTRLPWNLTLADDAYGVKDAKGDIWIPVSVLDTTGLLDKDRVGRLRTRDLRLERGPIVAREVSVEADGWIVARSSSAIHAINLATSQHVSAPSIGYAYLGFPWTRPQSGPSLLIDVVGGRYLTVDATGAANRAGCYLGASSRAPVLSMVGNVEHGPWQLRCAATGDLF